MKEQIILKLRESAELKLKLAKESIREIEEAADMVYKTLKAGGKILIFGNGGSAADAQHIAAEFVNRYQKDRRALPAIALTTDSSVITSIANDSSFDNVFSRQIEALGRKTSGRSANVVKALELAKSLGLKTLGFTGGDGGKVKKVADLCLVIPTASTPRIQELHITVAHIICELVEDLFLNKKEPSK